MSEDGLDKSRGQTNSKQPVKDPERGPTWHVCGKAEREMEDVEREQRGPGRQPGSRVQELLLLSYYLCYFSSQNLCYLGFYYRSIFLFI